MDENGGINATNPLLDKSLPNDMIASDSLQLYNDKNEKMIFVNLFFQPIKAGSLRSSIFCMICVTLGTGMLPLPYFFYKNGIALTLIIFLICGISTYFTLKKLIDLAFEKKTYDYSLLVGQYYGNKMIGFSICLLLINSFGSIITWDVFIAKFIKDILNFFNPKLDTDLNVVYILIGILIFIQIPLAANMQGRAFGIFSFIGILQILYVILILFYEFPEYASENFTFDRMVEMRTYFNFNYKLIDMPFVFFIAFGNHSTILSVINEIKDKNQNRVQNVGKRTFFAEIFIYIAVVFVSYFSTFENTNEVFLVRPHLSLLMMIGEFFMMLLMIINIELYFFTTNPTLEFVLNDNEKFTQKQNFLSAFTVLTILMFISFYVDRVISILSFIGIVAQVGLIFIIPGMIYLKAKGNTMKILQKTNYVLFISFFSLLGLLGFVIKVLSQFSDLFYF